MTWTVPGYYEIKELGRGASGRVVLAEHQGTGVKVAIKYLAPHLARDPEFISAFRAEARILSEVDNPQIARLYEYIEGPEGAAIVMELVDGVALRQIIKTHGPTEPQSALLVLKGSLLGLAAAHQHGIVHRDYKPENVLVNQVGESKLADFGIAARTGLQGAHAGTPSYMAPEQWAGAPASPSTDIYAATATFFECLVGVPPYRAPGDLLALRSQHESAPIPVDAVPEQVRGLVRRGLAKKVEHRPRDAATFLAELEAVAGAGYGPDWEEEGRSALARRAALLLLLFPLAGLAAGGTGAAKTILGWSRKSFYTAIGGAAALLIALGGGGAYYLSQDDTPLPTPLPVVSESESPAPSPSPSPSPSESPSPSPSASPSKSPSPKPSPGVVGFTAPTLPEDFCWWDLKNAKCVPIPPGGAVPHARVKITVKTKTGDAFHLKLRFVQVYTPLRTTQEVEITNGQANPPILIVDVPVPAGGTTRTVTTDIINLSSFWNSDCRYYTSENPRIKLTITADIPGAASAPVYIADRLCELT